MATHNNTRNRTPTFIPATSGIHARRSPVRFKSQLGKRNRECETPVSTSDGSNSPSSSNFVTYFSGDPPVPEEENLQSSEPTSQHSVYPGRGSG
ncbi:uncharacterized protein N7515_000003 [Penicillium bovifimosum]|uniref:Uncharacterized protein n=1 Tax=Penicillium bovifimosum TaxID=126998 RepID=A0A9W9HEA9_9EURO|nr:uncharacterized protein N7515_000003 [Penicillium bovifimosum]KAJ5145439.1 hypothetical protein N7515_000003 [Penicillium bovifimosum]